MNVEERRMFYAMALYVCLDSLGKIIDLIERFIPDNGR